MASFQMTSFAFVGAFFVAGLLGAVLWKSVSVRVEWAVACVICFWGMAMYAIPEPPTAEESRAYVNRTLTTSAADMVAFRLSIKKLERERDALSRLANHEIGRGDEVRRGDSFGAPPGIESAGH